MGVGVQLPVFGICLACKQALVFGFTLEPVLGTAAYHTTGSHLWKKLWKPLYNEVALHDAERCLKKLLF